MQLENTYYYFKSALTPEQCQRIIDLGNSKIFSEATTFGKTEKGKMPNAKPINDKTFSDLNVEENQEVLKNTYTRDSEVSWIDEKWVYELLSPYLEKANQKAGWYYDYDWSESIQFTKYGLNQFYGWHSDSGSCHYSTYKRLIPGVTPKEEIEKHPMQYVTNNNIIGKIRKLSMTVNLMPEGSYKGGNLKFDFGPHSHGKRYHECVEIRPQGSIIVFPSYIYHQVTPVTEGTRYSLVMWTLGRPFK
tara:strand:- start:3029 stop:3766 length:738 start_codon:yes stop_codon:yes gene_type:complete